MKLLLLTCLLTSAHGYAPYVKISEGGLLGTKYELPNGRKVLAFLGIPYAAPPIGQDRFGEPKPPVHWKGIRYATSMGNICLQTKPKANFTEEGHNIETIGDEDCLFINVFTPELPNDPNNEDELMNVLVFIHGGGFMFGSANTVYPDYILQDDNIVFVSFNYRLGALGFFSTADGVAPGNNGLKDQLEALRWVQRNIRQFGGNPAKVTIYGISAGAASVQYHMISPLTKGLFRSAITSSGSVSLPWSLQASVVHRSKQLASALNCEFGGSSNMMLECLRNKPIIEIMDEVYGKYNIEDGYLINFSFSPVIEPPTPGAFLSENPYNLMKNGAIKHIPWLISIAENEGALFGIDVIQNKNKINRINDKWNEEIPKIFSFNGPSSKKKKDYISAAIRKYYFKNGDLSQKTANQFYRALGDRHFANGIIETAKLYSSVSLANTYCYKFYYRGAESFSDVFDGKNHGSLHVEDSFYVLKTFTGKSKNKNDLDMAKLISSQIIAFMENGNPNIPESEVDWKPLSEYDGVMNCLGIYSKTVQRMEDIEDHNTTRFWNSLLPPQNYE